MMTDPRMVQLGQLAVRRGLITSQQLAAALKAQSEEQASSGRTRPIGDMLIDLGMISPEDLQGLLRQQAGKAARELAGFELISRLGAGGMGAVYKARQKSMDRIVALKVLPPRLAQDRSFIERFFREARAVAKLNHSNIVQGIDVGEASGYHYFAMEYVDGCSLKNLLESKGPLPEAQALGFIEQVAMGLAHAHAHGLIHRDIKPDNVLVDRQGVAKVCDLGLARQAQGESSLTQTGMTMGTPHYISPEQARGDSTLDARTDLYSLGATWFHILSGSPPYTADNPIAVLSKHLSAPVPRITSVRGDISAGTEAVIAKLMAKDPLQRYESAAELLKDIADLKAGRPPGIAGGAAPGHATSRFPPVRTRHTQLHEPVGVTAGGTPDIPPEFLATPSEHVGAAGRAVGMGTGTKLVLAAAVLLCAAAATWGIRTAMRGSGEPQVPGPGTDTGRVPDTGSAPEESVPPVIREIPMIDRRTAQLEEMYQHILRKAQETPDDFAGIEKRWGELQRAGAGTKYSLLAMDELAKLDQRRREAAAGRRAELKRRLDEAGREVDAMLADGRIGPAIEYVRQLQRELPPGAETQAFLREASGRVASISAEAVRRACAEARALAEAGDFVKARERLDELTAFGTPQAEQARAATLPEIDRLQDQKITAREREARERCREVMAGLGDLIRERRFAEAVGRIDAAARELSEAGREELTAPERALLAAAEEFMAACRRRAASPPQSLRLEVRGVEGPVEGYDPETDEISVVHQTSKVTAYGKDKLASLAEQQLLMLGGMADPSRVGPDDAAAAGCFLAASGLAERAEPYLRRAREAGKLSDFVERALAARGVTERERRASELLARLPELSQQKRWAECVAVAEELLREYPDATCVRAAEGKIRATLAAARASDKPGEERVPEVPRTDRGVPAEAKVYGLGTPAEAEEFTRDFSLGAISSVPGDAAPSVQLGGGLCQTAVRPGQALVISSSKRKYGEASSISFELGYAAPEKAVGIRTELGAVLSAMPQGQDRQLLLAVSAPERNQMVVGLFPYKNGRLPEFPIQPGRVCQRPDPKQTLQLRVSWKSPWLAWLVNGEPQGHVQVDRETADRISQSAMGLWFSLLREARGGESVGIKISRIAVGLPQEGDFPEPGAQPPREFPQRQPWPGPGPRDRSGGEPDSPPRFYPK